MREKIKSGEAVICEGWKREVKSLADRGYYRGGVVPVLKAFAGGALLYMDRAIESSGKAKKEAWRKFRELLGCLKDHREEVLKGDK